MLCEPKERKGKGEMREEKRGEKGDEKKREKNDPPFLSSIQFFFFVGSFSFFGTRSSERKKRKEVKKKEKERKEINKEEIKMSLRRKRREKFSLREDIYLKRMKK